MFKKLKQKSLITIKVNTNLLKKENMMSHKSIPHYVQDCHKVIDDLEVTLFEKGETHK